MPPLLARVAEPRQRLTRLKVCARLEARLQGASAQEVTSSDVLDRLRTGGVAVTGERPVTRRTVMARCPSRKTVETVDFGCQRSVNCERLQDLATCRCTARDEHVVWLGAPGPGKTHVVI
jgi:DNA replication protein DnaC